MRNTAHFAPIAVLSAIVVLIPSSALAAAPAVEPNTITVGSAPTGIAITPDGTKAYVTNYHNDNVSVINLSDNTVSPSPISVGNTPTSVAVSPSGSFAYVTNFDEPGGLNSSVSRLNLTTNPVTVTTITDASLRGPVDVVFSPDGSKAYVANRATASVSVIDSSTGAVTNISVPKGSENLAISSDGRYLYVSHNEDDMVSFIDLSTNPATVTTPITGQDGPQGLALVGSPGSQKLYVAMKGLNKVSVYDAITGAFQRDITGLTGPETITLNGPQNSATELLVTNPAGNTVKIIDISGATPSITSTLAVGSAPYGLALAPNGLTAYVANQGATTVSVISYYQARTLTFSSTSFTLANGSTQTVTATPSAGVGLGTLTYSAGASTACTVNSSTGAVTMTAATGTCSISASITRGGTSRDAAFRSATTSTPVTITPTAAAPTSGATGSTVRKSLEQTVAPTLPRVTPTRPATTPAPNTSPVTRPVDLRGTGFDPNAPLRGFIGGSPSRVTSTPLGSSGVSVFAGTFQFGLNLTEPLTNAVLLDTPSRSPELQIPRGYVTAVSGAGSFPGSLVQFWLPASGGEPRELARIPVRSDGTFVSDLTFGTGPTEMPLPIGRQVIQVVGYDRLGNQTVVDMTINIAQGVPSPEMNREEGELPALSGGQSLATSAGFPEQVSVSALPDTGSVLFEGTEWSIRVSAGGEQLTADGAGGVGPIRFELSSSHSAGGSGFLPGSLATVWFFSDPTLMTTVTVDENGEFVADFLVDERLIAPGQHTLQVQGVGSDGFIKAANLGVVVEEPQQTTSQGASALIYWAGLLVLLVILVGVFLVLALRRRRRIV